MGHPCRFTWGFHFLTAFFTVATTHSTTAIAASKKKVACNMSQGKNNPALLLNIPKASNRLLETIRDRVMETPIRVPGSRKSWKERQVLGTESTAWEPAGLSNVPLS